MPFAAHSSSRLQKAQLFHLLLEFLREQSFSDNYHARQRSPELVEFEMMQIMEVYSANEGISYPREYIK